MSNINQIVDSNMSELYEGWGKALLGAGLAAAVGLGGKAAYDHFNKPSKLGTAAKVAGGVAAAGGLAYGAKKAYDNRDAIKNKVGEIKDSFKNWWNKPAEKTPEQSEEKK